MILYGVVIKNKETQHKMTYWFDTKDAREQQVNFFSKEKYEIEEYLSDQMEFNFDTREG